MSDYEKKRFTTVDELDIVTIMSEDIVFEGELEFDDSLYIKGKMKGKINSTGDLYIGENAVVDATIKADFVSLKGHVIGNIYATRRVELYSSAQVDGDIITADIHVDSGCRFNGRCIMKNAQEIV